MSYEKPLGTRLLGRMYQPVCRCALTVWLVTALAGASAQAQPAARTAQARPPDKPPVVDVARLARERAALMGTELEASAAAAARLGSTSHPLALDALLDALALGLPPQVAAAALTAVATHADLRAYPTIRFFVSYRDARVRAAAVRAAGVLDDPRISGDVIAALSDSDVQVRAAAIEVAAARNLRSAIEPILALLAKGDEAAVSALAKLANPDVARALGELIGTAPDALVARTLGLILQRPDFEPEAARVQVVRALSKVPGNEAIAQLERYVQSIPDKPPRQSRREAEALAKDRRSGGDAGAARGNAGGPDTGPGGHPGRGPGAAGGPDTDPGGDPGRRPGAAGGGGNP